MAMFGKESKPCRVYEYGCLKPTAGEDVLVEELRRRNQFWNRLVEIERSHQAEARKLLTLPDDPIQALKEELKACRDEIKQRRKAKRSGKVDIADLEEKIAALKSQIAALTPVLREERKKAKESAAEELKQLESQRRTLVKQAQKESGLYWCNYDEVLTNYETARKRAMKEGKDLRFHCFDGSGKVTVRYQNGLPVEEVFKSSDTRLQIEPVPDQAWTSPFRSVRRKLARSVVRLRVQSDEHRNSVWVELPCILHRPMPADGIIRSASVVRERVGDRFQYKLVITVAYEPKQPRTIDSRKACGIDVGWRMVQDGLRVAYLVGAEGYEEQLILPRRMLNVFEKCEDLQSIRVKNFNAARDELSAWLTTHNGSWLDEEAKDLVQWRSPGRLAQLIDKWKDNRIPGDVEIFGKILAWRKQEWHLYQWQFNAKDQVLRWRREEYRKFAARVVKRYDVIALEKFDLRQVSRKSKAEKGTAGALPPNRQRVIAAVSELRLAIKNAASREGKEYLEFDAARTTITCHRCGHTEKFDAAKSVMHTCPVCGALWDQDRNAALNLLSQITQAFKQNCDLRESTVQ